ELLQQVSPGIARVAVFWDYTYAPTQAIFRELQAGAEVLGIELLSFDVRTPADFAPAFETALHERSDALSVFNDPLSQNQRGRILAFGARHRLPAVYNAKIWVDDGGLMAYAPSFPALYRRAAYYVGRILKGAKPADLPVEQPREFEFVINLKTAQALGLTIPEHVLLQATEVIQ